VLGSLGYGFHRSQVTAAVGQERLRTRIASDLHDDVASSLSQIAILSELATRETAGDANARAPLRRIASIARETIDAMSDIIWAIGPGGDRLSDLSHRMRRFASDLLADRDLRFEMPSAGSRDIRIDSDMRRQIYLVFKEAVHNVARHSGAAQVEIALEMLSGRLRLTVRDHGVGFQAESGIAGRGLASMQTRAHSLGGILEVAPAAGGGTELRMEIPLRRGGSPPDQVGRRLPGAM
jgi:signal transduction histidine kinase